MYVMRNSHEQQCIYMDRQHEAGEFARQPYMIEQNLALFYMLPRLIETSRIISLHEGLKFLYTMTSSEIDPRVRKNGRHYSISMVISSPQWFGRMN